MFLYDLTLEDFVYRVQSHTTIDGSIERRSFLDKDGRICPVTYSNACCPLKT